MGLFERFPYTNFHDLNLTWILNELKTLEHTINEFVSINALKYADPIQWNIVTQYEKNTIVIDPLTGTAYISVQPVPSGVAITNTDYWTVVFDLGSFVVRAAKNFTDKFEDETTLTATFPSNVNDWLIWGDILYRVISPIVAGDQYVDGSNIVHFTAEDVIGHIQDLSTDDKNNLVAAVNELVVNIAKIHNAFTPSNQGTNTNFDTAYGTTAMFWWHNELYVTTAAVNVGDPIQIGVNCQVTTMELAFTQVSASITNIINSIGSLALLNTVDQSSIVNAINEVNSKVGTLSSLHTTDQSNTVNAINEVFDSDSLLHNKKWIFVGDSYGESPNVGDDWCSQCVNAMAAHGITSYRCHISGGSFGNAVKYLTALQSIENNVPDPDTITDILVAGGFNDITMTKADIKTGISDFITYMQTQYPNAKLHIGLCALTSSGNMLGVTYWLAPTLLELQNELNFEFISSSIYILRDYTKLFDGVHPNASGALDIAYGFTNYVLNREVGIYNQYGGATFTLDPTDIDASSSPITDTELRSFDDVQIVLNLLTIKFATAGNVWGKKIATFNPKYFYGHYKVQIPFTMMALISGVKTPFSGWLEMEHGNIWIYSLDASAVDTIYFQPLTFVAPLTIA